MKLHVYRRSPWARFFSRTHTLDAESIDDALEALSRLTVELGWCTPDPAELFVLQIEDGGALHLVYAEAPKFKRHH